MKVLNLGRVRLWRLAGFLCLLCCSLICGRWQVAFADLPESITLPNGKTINTRDFAEYAKKNPSAFPTPTQDQLREIMPKIAETVLEIYKVEPGSKEAQNIKDVVLRKNIPEAPKGPGTKFPLNHYVFKEGSDLPSAEQMQQEQEKIQLALADIKSNIIENIKKQRPARKAREIKLAPVIHKPQCAKSASASLNIPPGYLVEGRPIDLLFFEGKPPFDVKTTIGKQTVLVSFGDPATSEVVSVYGNLNIDCVPFRLRSTGKKAIYSKGAHALKNYDANPDADGTFDPTIKKYIQQVNLKE